MKLIEKEQMAFNNAVNVNFHARMQGKGPKAFDVRGSYGTSTGPIKEFFETTRKGLNNFQVGGKQRLDYSEPARGRLQNGRKTVGMQADKVGSGPNSGLSSFNQTKRSDHLGGSLNPLSSTNKHIKMSGTMGT